MAQPNVIQVRYEGFSQALEGLSLEDRAGVIYGAICRPEHRVTFKTVITDELASLVGEAINYFCTLGRFHPQFYEAAHLTIETDQKDVARFILVKALTDEQAKEERYVDGDVGVIPENLEKYGYLAKKILDDGLGKELYSLYIAVALRNIRAGLLANYGYLTRLVEKDKAPELIDELVNGLLNIGAIYMAASYCRKAAENETRRGNVQLGDRLIEKATQLEKAAPPLRL